MQSATMPLHGFIDLMPRMLVTPVVLAGSVLVAAACRDPREPAFQKFAASAHYLSKAMLLSCTGC